jgi:hypothetical protein
LIKFIRRQWAMIFEHGGLRSVVGLAHDLLHIAGLPGLLRRIWEEQRKQDCNYRVHNEAAGHFVQLVAPQFTHFVTGVAHDLPSIAVRAHLEVSLVLPII